MYIKKVLDFGLCYILFHHGCSKSKVYKISLSLHLSGNLDNKNIKVRIIEWYTNCNSFCKAIVWLKAACTDIM